MCLKRPVVMDKNNIECPSDEEYDGVTYKGNKGPRFGSRHVQILLMAIGNGYAFTTKSVMSSLIVAMTDNTTSPNPNVPAYDWNNTGTILSSIMWTGMFVTMLSGYLGKRYGPKWFTVGSSIANCAVFMLIPAAAKLGGSTGVIVCRMLQGIAINCLSTQNSVIMGSWNPPEERARMGYAGSFVLIICMVAGTLTTGFIASSRAGWPWVFYIFGGGGLVWSATYAFWGANNPNEHKTIDRNEQRYLQLACHVVDNKAPTPWREIYTSIHFWAIVVGTSGFTWITVMTSTQLPLFLARVMQYDLRSNVLITTAPVLTNIFVGVAIAVLSDMITTRKILTILTSRRVFHLTGCFGVCMCYIGMTFIPLEYRSYTIAALCVADVFLLFAAIGGANLNTLDIAPEFSGIIGGFSGTFSEFISLFAPLTVQWMCPDLSDASQWKNVFYVTLAIASSSAVFFAVFATDKRQNWGKQKVDGATDGNCEEKQNSVTDGNLA